VGAHLRKIHLYAVRRTYVFQPGEYFGIVVGPPGDEVMRPIQVRRRKPAGLPIAWREAEYAALQANADDKCDDKVSDDIFDVDDERAEIDSIMHRIEHDALT
jgi:hypothetical protein